MAPDCAGSNYYVRILSTLNRELLKPSASIALHRHSNALVDILPPEADSSISLLTQSERPDVSYTVRHCPYPEPPRCQPKWTASCRDDALLPGTICPRGHAINTRRNIRIHMSAT